MSAYRILFIAWAVLLIGLIVGCATTGTTGPGISDAKGIEAKIADLSKQVAQNAGRDSRYNDDMTFRMAVSGLILLGLSYPIGKLVWLIGRRAKRLTGTKKGEA